MDINWIVDSPFESLPVGDPSTLALSIDGVDSLTYGQLRELRNRYVHLLQEAGVKPGDRVGIMLLNSLDYVALYFAIARIGAIAVRVNFRLTPVELEYILTDSGCSAVVLHTSRIGQIAPIRHRVPVGHWLLIPDNQDPAPYPDWARLAELDTLPTDDSDLPRPDGSDLLMLMYTSGTTGRPKGVMWTHDNALWLAFSQSLKWSYTSQTVAMTTGPLYHAGAFEVLLLPALFVHGTAVAMSSGGMSTQRIASTIGRVSVTHVMLYPFALYDLLREADLYRSDVCSLRAILSGGDPVLPWALIAAEQKFPGVEVQQGYGLTEATMSSCLDHVDRLAHPDSVGRPMPLTQVRTVGSDGAPVSVGEVGEVWIRSPWVARGYWHKPAETGETFVDGWCRTGDLGRVTPDGFLVLTGRAKDMIRSGGENIYPAEVEAALAEHPYVSAVAVIGVPHAKYIEVGCAVIVPTLDATGRAEASVRQELQDFLEHRLASYKRPKHYVFVTELPLSAAGKLQKQLLRSQYASLGSAVEPIVSA